MLLTWPQVILCINTIITQSSISRNFSRNNTPLSPNYSTLPSPIIPVSLPHETERTASWSSTASQTTPKFQAHPLWNVSHRNTTLSNEGAVSPPQPRCTLSRGSGSSDPTWRSSSARSAPKKAGMPSLVDESEDVSLAQSGRPARFSGRSLCVWNKNLHLAFLFCFRFGHISSFFLLV